MALKYLGYTERKTEIRALTMAELKLAIIRAYVKGNAKDVQIIDITSGDVEFFKSIEDVVKNEWCEDLKIELINMPHNYGCDDDYKTVIVFQEAEDDFKVI